LSEPIREAIRALAEQEGISQNELLEQAASHEIIARGALAADDLEVAAARLRSMSSAAHAELVEASIEEFVHGEALPDPMRAKRVDRVGEGEQTRLRPVSRLGAVDAFRHR
jgi:hypothetical protein